MAAAFPSIYYTLRRTNDVTFSEAGNGSRSSFCLKAKSHIIMKTKTKSAQVPVAKLQNYFSELSALLTQSEGNLLVRRSDDGTTSIRLTRGQYLTISLQKGGQQ